jgi:hypothetical protein
MVTTQSRNEIGNMSHGSTDRARAIREYKRLRASARHALLLAENTRCGIDTMLRLQDESAEMFTLANEIDRRWNLTRNYDEEY